MFLLRFELSFPIRFGRVHYCSVTLKTVETEAYYSVLSCRYEFPQLVWQTPGFPRRETIFPEASILFLYTQ